MRHPQCGLVAAALLLAASSVQAADTLHIGVAAVYPPYSIPYAALELGFYEKAGLAVDITTYRGSAPEQEALVSGVADVIVAPPHAVALARSKGIKERIFAFDGETRPSGWHLMVLAASPYKTVADLAGKKIGIGGKGSTSDLMVLLALSQAKIKAMTIPMGTQEIMGSLKAQQIDAGITGPVPGYRSLLSGIYRSVVNYEELKDPLVFNAWLALDRQIEERPNVLRKWLAANKEAIEYMQANEKWALAFLKRYSEEADNHIVQLFYDDTIKQLKPDQVVRMDWLATELQLATESGIPNLPSPDQIYTDKIAPAAAQ